MKVLRAFAAILLVLGLAACDGSATAGNRGNAPEGGAGGTPSLGTSPDAGFGGEGGVPVELSFVSFAVRSAYWVPGLDEEPAFASYTMVLDEAPRGCETVRDERFGPGPHRFVVVLDRPRVGECPTDGGSASGCRASVWFYPAGGRGIGLWVLRPEAATLRIDRFDGGMIRGELRASFHVDPETQVGSGGGSRGDYLMCQSPTGAIRTCWQENFDHDCCNDGKPLEEVTIPFEATLCPGAVSCEGTWCEVLERTLECPVPEVDCEAACAGYAASCGSCADCGGDPECESWHASRCEARVAACPERCAAEGGLPLAAVGFSCFAAGATCESWTSCLSSCGDNP
jgi:hypothetical protein